MNVRSGALVVALCVALGSTGCELAVTSTGGNSPQPSLPPLAPTNDNNANNSNSSTGITDTNNQNNANNSSNANSGWVDNSNNANNANSAISPSDSNNVNNANIPGPFSNVNDPNNANNANNSNGSIASNSNASSGGGQSNLNDPGANANATVVPTTSPFNVGAPPTGKVLVMNLRQSAGEAWDPSNPTAPVDVELFYKGVNMKLQASANKRGTNLPGLTMPDHAFDEQTPWPGIKAGDLVYVTARTKDGRSALIATVVMGPDPGDAK